MAESIPTGQAPGGLVAKFAALSAQLDGTAGALGRIAPLFDAAADKVKKLADAQDALNMKLAIQKDLMVHNAEIMKDNVEAAKPLEDAFGRIANGLSNVSAEADHATDGLQGVAWEMRHATQASFSLNESQKALVESLAKVSDAGGASSLWVGHLIAQLEKGEITFDQFTQKVNQLLQELTKLGPVMGNTAGELNEINSLLSAFKNTSTDGWPGGLAPGGGGLKPGGGGLKP